MSNFRSETSYKIFRFLGENEGIFMDDACGSQFQETGQKQRLARMVGHSSLDSAATGKDAGSFQRNPRMRKRGGV